MADASLQAVLDRALRALGNNSPAQAADKVRAIIGSRNIPDSEAAAQLALDTLYEGREPTPQQLAALEIVVRLLRPVVLAQGGKLQDLPENANGDLRTQESKDSWSAFRAVAEPLVGSIGRIENSDNRHVGTGFVVGDGLIATNRHVLAALNFGAEVLAEGNARIVFKQEKGASNTTSDICPIAEVVTVHPSQDIAILSVPTAKRPAVMFGTATPSTGSGIVTIGFPGKDELNNPLFLTSVFNGNFGVKSAALGEILEGSAKSDLFHDCSTTQGNSGSPVFDIATGRVVGIHRSGYFMYRNEAVGSAEIQTLIRV